MAARLTKKTIIILISAAVVLVGGGVAAAAIALNSANQEPSTEGFEKRRSEYAGPERPVDLPRVTTARVAADGWTLAARTVVAAVLPEVGDAADGAVSLRVDAPTGSEGVVAASVPVTLAPDTEYTLTASVRMLERYRTASGVRLAIADQSFELPELNAVWEPVEFTFTTPAAQAEGAFSVVLSDAVRGFGIDDVSLTASGGENLVPNGSFEQVPAPQGIVSDSLILPASSTTLAVSLAGGAATWSAQSSSGGDPVTGAAEVAAGLSPLRLDGLPQGHYALTVTDAAGLQVATNVAVVDTEGTAVPQDPRFGVSTHVERVGFDGAGMMAASLGFSEARNDVTWSWNEKAPGQYVWSQKYINGFGELKANGVELLALVVYGNKLYGSERTPSTAKAVEAYGTYAREIARTFDVVGIEVFNEFNHRKSDASCGQAASCYVPLLESVHRQVKAEFPDLPVVAGSTAYYDRDWFIDLWQSGGLPYTDAISYHPYEAWRDRAPDSLGPIVAQSHADVKEFGGEDRPVWITEFGYPTHNPGGVSLMEQSDWLVRTEVDSIAAGTEKFFWYDLVNDKEDRAAGEANFGLFEHNPRPNVLARSPKPAAFAQALLITQVAGLAHVGAESDQTTRVEVFGEGEEVTRVAWAPGGQGERVFDSAGAVTVVSMSGATTQIEPVDGKITVPLTASPVFIHGLGAPAAG